MTAAATVSLLVVGFAETLIFFVIAHLGKGPSFFGVFSAIQGVGSIAGGLTAASLLRRAGDVRIVGVGLGLFGLGDLLLIVPSLPIVLLGFTIAGVGIMWAIVGFTTALQLRTPLAIQGRVSAAADISLTIAQTVSIATGAALSTVVDYRVLFVAMAVVVVASASYLVTRQNETAAPPIEQLVT
jgi:MFS family permease